jgi:hypothetical protein
MPRAAGARREGGTVTSRLIAIVCLALANVGLATVYEGSPNDYRQSIKRLRAGDTLLLAAGEYQEGLQVHGLSGAADRPIVISGPAQGASATFVAQAGRNTVSIVDSSFVLIRNLVLEGNNVPVDGVKAEGHARWAHHITLENLVIRGHGNNQQIVGISTKCPAWNWVIRDVTIIGAGTGMYLGNSDGSAPFVAGLIERSLIVDSIGYNLQIKHQSRGPTFRACRVRRASRSSATTSSPSPCGLGRSGASQCARRPFSARGSRGRGQLCGLRQFLLSESA